VQISRHAGGKLTDFLLLTTINVIYRLCFTCTLCYFCIVFVSVMSLCLFLKFVIFYCCTCTF